MTASETIQPVPELQNSVVPGAVLSAALFTIHGSPCSGKRMEQGIEFHAEGLTSL